MVRELKFIIPILLSILIFSCFEKATEGNNLSSTGFYDSPREVIEKLDNEDAGYREHFLLGLAFDAEKKYKSAIFHFANSAFKYHSDPDLTLYPGPVYEYLDGFHINSPYYNDSVYEVARLFYDYREFEYVVKFIDLIDDSERALYRDAVILKTRALVELKKYNEALIILKGLLDTFKDNASRSDMYIRIASAHENEEEWRKAVKEYLNIIDIDPGTWQSGIAARRIIHLLGKCDHKLDHAAAMALARALYSSREYDESIKIIEGLLAGDLPGQISKEAQEYLVRLFVRKRKYREAEQYAGKLGEKSGEPYRYLDIMADELWNINSKGRAVRIYRKIMEQEGLPFYKKAFKRVALHAIREDAKNLSGVLNGFIEKYPEDAASEFFLWILARECIEKKDHKEAFIYLKRAVSGFPDGIYSAENRFWLFKLHNIGNSPEEAEDSLISLAFYDPDSSYTWTALDSVKNLYKSEDLKKRFEEAVKTEDYKKANFYNIMLLLINQNFDERDHRIEQLKTGMGIDKFSDVLDEIEDLNISSEYTDQLKGIEKYFALGYIDGINREISIIPDDDKFQKEIYIAFAHYGERYDSYYHALIGTLKLFNHYDLMENPGLLPRGLFERIYPMAFPDAVLKRCKEAGIEKELILSVIKAESSFNHRAVSPAGAAGLMQIMPATGRDLARNLGVKEYDLLHPETSIHFGVKYLAWLKKLFDGDFEDIVAGYNAGAGNVRKWKKRLETGDRDYYVEFMPFRETRYYVLRTKKFYIIYRILMNSGDFYK